ncbi:blastula protease 10 isoform X2 [Hyalella azteca]|nr:blastula protease 10 isoform X2 [Hyalella azteca]
MQELFDLFVDEEEEKETLQSIWPPGIFNWKANSEGWPEVLYRFYNDSIIKPGILRAIAHWEEHTCVKFRDVGTGGAYPHVVFQWSANYCSSNVGRKPISFSGQAVQLTTGCLLDVGVVIHEIGHALGLWHQQTRHDREYNVKVIFGNMAFSNIFNNFPLITENYGVPYDYTSIMHYDTLGFSTGNSVLVTRNVMAQGLIGNRKGLSHMDKKIVNIQYGCIDKWLEACSQSSDPCLNFGYFGSDCKCVCPDGTTGERCQVKEMDYTDAMIAERLPHNSDVTTAGTVSTPNYPTPLNEGGRYTTRITAPAGKKVSLKFNAFDLADRCSRTGGNICCLDGLEIRLNGLTSGTWYCGKEIAAGTEFTSAGNELVLYFSGLNYTDYSFMTEHTGYSAEVTFV